MKQRKDIPENITEFDRKLARNQKAVTLAKEIVTLLPEKRAQRLQALQSKILEGTASLFEEKVVANLLRPLRAELILTISQKLPADEPQVKTQIILKDAPVAPLPSNPSSSTEAEQPSSNEFPSELLQFLATQKPPSAPPSSPASRRRAGTASEPQKPSAWRRGDILLGLGFILFFIIAIGYMKFSTPSSTSLQTFRQQAAEEQAPDGMSQERFRQMQDLFDSALQELRTGDFEQGKTQMLQFIDMYPNTSLAGDAHLAIADTYRQRQNNPDDALKQYQNFLDRYPDNPQSGLAKLKMGFAYEDMLDRDSAAHMYRLVLEQHGETSRVGQLANERLRALQSIP